MVRPRVRIHLQVTSLLYISVFSADQRPRTPSSRSQKLADLFREANLKVATQKYEYHPSHRNITGENVYAILRVWP